MGPDQFQHLSGLHQPQSVRLSGWQPSDGCFFYLIFTKECPNIVATYHFNIYVAQPGERPGEGRGGVTRLFRPLIFVVCLFSVHEDKVHLPPPPPPPHPPPPPPPPPPVAQVAVLSKVVDQLLLIYCFMYLPLFVGVLCWSLFWYALLYVLSSFPIILAGCFAFMSFGCPITVNVL